VIAWEAMEGIGYLSVWGAYLHSNPLAWLLEEDNPSARYLALIQLLGRSDEDTEVHEAQSAIVACPPASHILEAQYPGGYWIKPDRGYSPRYRATVWQVLFLAQLGVPRIPAIQRAYEHLLTHSYLERTGLFSAYKDPSGAFLCLNGNLLWALRRFGYGQHPAVRRMTERLAEVVLRERFRCRGGVSVVGDRRGQLFCVWGTIKVLQAFAAIPPPQRSPEVERATRDGVDFLLDSGLITADPPCERGGSRYWSQLGFPLSHESDFLERLEVLAKLGLEEDPRLGEAVKVLLDRQDREGRWPLERTPTPAWAPFGQCGRPNKWVTLRALRALSRIAPSILTWHCPDR